MYMYYKGFLKIAESEHITRTMFTAFLLDFNLFFKWSFGKQFRKIEICTLFIVKMNN